MVEKRRSLSSEALPAAEDGHQRKKQTTERSVASPAAPHAQALRVMRPGSDFNGPPSSSADDSARPMSVDLPTPPPDDEDAAAMEVDDEATAHPQVQEPHPIPNADGGADASAGNAALLQSAFAAATGALGTAATEDAATLVFRHFLPVITNKPRVLTPALADALGCEWRIVWYPHGVVDGEYASVLVEMVVPEPQEPPQEQEKEPPEQPQEEKEAVRYVEVGVVLRHPQDASGQSNHAKLSAVHAFSREAREFGISQFIRRRELLDPEKGFLAANSRVRIDVRLRFADADPLAATADRVAGLSGDRLALEMAAQQLRRHVGASLEDVTSAADGDEGDAPPCAAADGPAAEDGLRQLFAYDSKHETGMVGLKNQGATCYLNSLLQTLFHLRAFRQVVYETPTQQEDTTNSVSLALQRVFYRLQMQDKAVSTKELTRSFGWSQIDSFMQHDVQELYRILCDRLEEKMKRTKVDSAIKRLFEGQVRSFVRCVDVDFQSFRDESFYDLQLDVKGCKDVYASLRKYVETELLQGDNQYEAEGYGKQDAQKGVRFLQLPPVLNIQLKRYEYDPMRDGMVKIHDRFEFPTTLVLDEFLPDGDADVDVDVDADTDVDTAHPEPEPAAANRPDGGAGRTPKHVYHLHSVLVHSGDVHGGHYYVFTRPGKDISRSSDWFRFDDDQITRVDESVAVEGNFGSAPSTAAADTSRPASPLYSPSLVSSPDPAAASAHDEASGLEFRSVDVPTPADKDPSADDVYEYSRSSDPALLSTADSASASGLALPLARSFSSAYMLVYVRDGNNDISAIRGDAAKAAAAAAPAGPSQDVEMEEDASSAPPEDADAVAVPLELVRRFQKEEKAAARRKKLQQTEHLFMNLRVASDTSVAGLRRFTKSVDFSPFGNAACLRLRMRRSGSVRELYRRVYRRTGVPVARQRLWKVITRENRTHRPDQPLLPEALDLRVEALIDDDASPKAPVRLFLQILSPAGEGGSCVLHRHLWSEFTPPESESEREGGSHEGGDAEDAEDENEDEDEEKEDVEDGMDDTDGGEEARRQRADGACAPSRPLRRPTAPGCCPEPLGEHEILLFVKHYDVARALGERLEYKGNLLVDARRTGAELAAMLREALRIPPSAELALYEEVQPTAVQRIDMAATLAAAELQHGDIICYQLAGRSAARGSTAGRVVLRPELADEPDPDLDARLVAPGEDEDEDEDKEASADGSRSGDGAARPAAERYPDVPSYFRYLLDRVEVVFQRYGHADADPLVLELLQSNVYDEVVDALAGRLGLRGAERLHLRLYQHSPLSGLPMRSPLRHARYAGDAQTTLEELLTEYLERTNTLYYELLPCPITEIEAKKQLRVYLSAYDACLADAGAPAGAARGLSRRVELLVLPTDTARRVQQLVRERLALPEGQALRVCEAVQHGTVIRAVLGDDASLERFWAGGAASPSRGSGEAPALFVECVPKEEAEEERAAAAATGAADGEAGEVFYKGVAHFHFQSSASAWIQPHGVPLVVRFREHETVAQVKARIRRRVGVSKETFDGWNLALVKDLKATTLRALYEELDAEGVDALPMARLEEVCGCAFDHISGFGLEHADPAPKGLASAPRHREQGIRIRQD